jgi:hypothetical protein
VMSRRISRAASCFEISRSASLLSILSKLGIRSHVLSKRNKCTTLRSTTGQPDRRERIAGNHGKPETLNTVRSLLSCNEP